MKCSKQANTVVWSQVNAMGSVDPCLSSAEELAVPTGLFWKILLFLLVLYHSSLMLNGFTKSWDTTLETAAVGRNDCLQASGQLNRTSHVPRAHYATSVTNWQRRTNHTASSGCWRQVLWQEKLQNSQNFSRSISTLFVPINPLLRIYFQ